MTAIETEGAPSKKELLKLQAKPLAFNE